MAAWRDELDNFIRAFSGAFLFGMPLLFTMEMWWIGQYVDRWQLLTFLALALLANLGLTYVAGFKRHSTFVTTIDEAIDAVAVGIVGAVVVLLVLNRLDLAEPLDSLLGKIVIQAVPLSIGASVANQVFGRPGEKSRQGEEAEHHPLTPSKALFNDVGATMIGGIFVGFSIAPTEEIPMLAAALEGPHLLAVIGFSLLVSYAVVFASGFDQMPGQGLFQHPITETALAYLVSLLVALVTLYLFGQVRPGEPPGEALAQVLVLGLPMTIGGAAGRLVI